MSNELISIAVTGARASLEVYADTTPPENQDIRDTAVYVVTGAAVFVFGCWLARTLIRKLN